MAGSFIPSFRTPPQPGLLPSSRLASFKNQQLGGLVGPRSVPAPAGGPVASPMAESASVRAAKAVGPNLSAVATQSVGTTKRVSEGNARLAAIQRAAKPKTAQALGGQYTGSSSKIGTGAGRGRGQISVKDTVRVGNAYLRKDAGNAFIQMSSAFKQATGRSLGITEGWRSYDEQARLYSLYKQGRGNLAAVPGTSTHGKGTAVDLNGYGDPNGAAFKWLQQNATRFGYKWTGGTFKQVEPWHWDFMG